MDPITDPQLAELLAQVTAVVSATAPDDTNTDEIAQAVFESAVYWEDWYPEGPGAEAISNAPLFLEVEKLVRADAKNGAQVPDLDALSRSIYSRVTGWPSWYWEQQTFNDYEDAASDSEDNETAYRYNPQT